MKLKAKIKSKYLDQILHGLKREEFRQIESVTLIDEKGRECEFEVKGIKQLSPKHIKELKKCYKDIKWDDNLLTVRIDLGKLLGRSDLDEEKMS